MVQKALQGVRLNSALIVGAARTVQEGGRRDNSASLNHGRRWRRSLATIGRKTMLSPDGNPGEQNMAAGVSLGLKQAVSYLKNPTAPRVGNATAFRSVVFPPWWAGSGRRLAVPVGRWIR